ncbi:MAG: SMC family ATPase [Chloroflexota bacterium]
MIPTRLELTNFLSYRETAVLEFDGIHLACISGLNGAGKSSILDAITWALFGKSRSKSDDDVVNRLAILEEGTAEVKFTFILEGNAYRVVRRKRFGKSGALEFQVASGDDHWKTLSESKMRETQIAIEQLLRMNYDTFTNASFLLQGKADEFTTKTPGRRKEILADLLGVSQWDRYKEAAAARRKEEEGRMQLLQGQLAEIEAELAEEEERKTLLAAAQAELATISERRAVKEQLLQQARQTETAVKQQRQLVQTMQQNLQREQRKLHDLQQTASQRQQEQTAYQAILAEAATITADYAAWQEADSTLQIWQNKADAYNRLQQAKRPFELTLTQERSRLEQQQRELEKRQREVAAARDEQQTVTQQLAAGQAQLAQLETNLSALAEQEQAWQSARDELHRLQSEHKLLAQQVDQLQGQAKRIEALRQEETAVTQNQQAAQTRLTDLTAQLAALAVQRDQYSRSLADRDSLEADQPRLREQMNKLKERIDRLTTEVGGSCPLCGQPLSEAHRQDVLAELQTEGKELGDRFRINKERLAALVQEVANLEKQLKRLPQVERDQQAQQQRLAQAEAKLAEIAQTIAAWEADEAPRLAQLTAQFADDAALQAQQQQVDQLATAVQEKVRLEKAQQTQQRRVSTLSARLTELDRLITTWDKEGEAQLAQVAETLLAKTYASDAQTELARLDAEAAALAYDNAAHEAARATRNALAEAAPRYQQLQQAEAAVRPLQDSLLELQQRIAEQEQSVAELTTQQETAVSQLDTLTANSGELRTIEDEVYELRETESIRQRTVGAAQQRLAVLDDLRQRQKSIHSQQAAVSQQIQRLKALEKACGRDGVQALLIEQALPEIEDRANELLERLTGGDMRVSFDTQRQLKSRDATVETLDIHITDGAGERPYENFSGGEQFRVNFAIRLALSQILAKRAGARLQTLVIDEGFGSQDPNGRQRLVEAINAIQDDFARILVITHIDELRDAFPARIEVAKTITGSTIAVS